MLGSFGGGLGFGLAFCLKDEFSGNASKIQGSMGALDSKTGKMTSSVGGKLMKLGGILGVGFSLGKAIKGAAELSDQMVGLEMVTGMSAAEMEGLRAQLEGMDTRTGLSELLGLTEIGSQLGVAKEELAGFAKTADDIGLVLGKKLGGSAEAAVTKIAKLNKLFKDTKDLDVEDGLKKMSSAIDTLSDKTTANISTVTNFASKLGELGGLGPTAAQALGLGTALDELGVKMKGMSSQFGNIMTVIGRSDKSMAMFANQVGMTTGEFKNMFATDPNEVMLKLAQSMKGLDNKAMVSRMKKLGIGTQEAAKFLGTLRDNIDLVRERQQMATEAFRKGSSVTTEANKKNLTFAAQLEKLQRNFQIFLTRIGDAIALGLAPLLDILNWLLKAMTKFAASPFGKAVIKYTTYIVGFTAGVLALAKGIKIMGSAFKIATRQAYRLMIALWPVALMAAPIIGIVMAVRKATSAFEDFDGTVKSGFGGFWQKLGGIIQAIKEVWSSWDRAKQTFMISGKTMEKLQKLGIDKWAVSIGTWVIRIKEFVWGVFQGIYEALKAVWDFVEPVLTWIGDKLAEWGIISAENTSATEKWVQAGKILGYIIAAVLIAIGIIALAIAAIIILVVGIIVLLIWAVWKAAQAVYYALKWVWDGIAAGLSWLYEQFLWIISFFDPVAWAQWGANAIKGLWDGIKSMWGQFTSWIYNSVKKVPLLGSIVAFAYGDTEGMAESLGVQLAPEPGGESTGIMESGVSNKVGMSGAGAGGGFGDMMQLPPQKIEVNIDGEKVGEAVTNYQDNENSRE